MLPLHRSAHDSRREPPPFGVARARLGDFKLGRRSMEGRLRLLQGIEEVWRETLTPRGLQIILHQSHLGMVTTIVAAHADRDD